MRALMELFCAFRVLFWALRELFCRFSIKDPKADGSFPRAISEAKPAAWSVGRLATSDAMASEDDR